MYPWMRIGLAGICTAVLGAAANGHQERTRVLFGSQEFVFTSAPFPSAHASTIVETAAGLVAAWFHRTGQPHGATHASLRKECGGPAAAVATADQLRARIVALRDKAARKSS